MPNVRKIVYNVDIKRVMRLKLWLGIADGWLSTDGEIIYRAKDLKVGLFKQGAASAGNLRLPRPGRYSVSTTAITQKRNDRARRS